MTRIPVLIKTLEEKELVERFRAVARPDITHHTVRRWLLTVTGITFSDDQTKDARKHFGCSPKMGGKRTSARSASPVIVRR